MGREVKISVVIPTRRPDSVKKMIETLDYPGNPHELEVIVVDHEDGMNAKLNFGMRLARGDYIATLHDDMSATPGWLDKLPEDGVGAFKIGEMNDSFDCWGGLGRGYCRSIDDNPDYSAFLIFSRAAYANIGPVDEFYEEPGHQDTDLGRQIYDKGYKIECLPGKLIHHHERDFPLNKSNEKYFNKKWDGN